MCTFRKLSLCFLMLIACTTLRAQSKNAEKVLDNETRRFDAMTRADTTTLRLLLADELVYIHSNALKENKQEHLTAIASRKLIYEKMDREVASVRFYGKTALVNGIVKVRGMLNNSSFEVRLLYLAVYRKKKGVWQMVNWQSTKMV